MRPTESDSAADDVERKVEGEAEGDRDPEPERPSTVQEEEGVSPDRLDDPPQAEGDRRGGDPADTD